MRIRKPRSSRRAASRIQSTAREVDLGAPPGLERHAERSSTRRARASTAGPRRRAVEPSPSRRRRPRAGRRSRITTWCTGIASSSSLAKSTPSNDAGSSARRGHEPLGDVAERLALRRAGRRARFDEMQSHADRRTRDRGARGAQDVADSRPLPAPASTRSTASAAGALRDLRLTSRMSAISAIWTCEQLAEDRPDVDAGKKIARAPGTLGGAGVVAGSRVVERELHERGHGDRAAFTDDRRSRSVGSFLLHRDEHLAVAAPDENLRDAARRDASSSRPRRPALATGLRLTARITSPARRRAAPPDRPDRRR